MRDHLEITSIVPCPNMCSYCPQDKLKNAYKGEKILTLEKFKEALKNVPKDTVKIHFSGFSEIFTNPEGHEIVRYACEEGYTVQIYTTTVGLDTEKIKDLDFDVFSVNKVNTVVNPISRAGNNWDIEKKEGDLVCVDSPEFRQNVMLPNGDVYLCCMDYSLKHKLGNIFKTNFEDLKRDKAYELCRKCEISK